jgi:SAM-dependent methyltransferase
MSSEGDVPGVKGYLGTDAKRLAARYESGKFEQIHEVWLRYLPPKGATVVDIGSGSGRDASALSERAFVVTAVDPSADMITEARLLHPSSNIEWIQDHLPRLRTLVANHRTFDLLLLSAVWMHLSADDRVLAMNTLVGLMNPGAITVITLRHPIDPSRHMFDVDPEETVQAARGYGLDVLFNETIKDPVPNWARDEVFWSFLGFRRAAA